MSRRVVILVGTKKGAFILEADTDRRSWELRGPLCEAWPLNHVVADPTTGAIYATGGNEWFGPAVWKSTDLGASWTHSSEGLSYGEGETPIKAGWSLAPAGGALYCGVEPAGLFRSEDGGLSWRHVAALRAHPSRPQWQPGGGGLILHHIEAHAADPQKLWVGISTAGVFHSADGGASWEPRNRGTRCDYLPEEQRYPEVGQCVHSIALAPGTAERLYQQNHCGMYRSEDGGRRWESIEAGLPSSFGFASAVHPRDPDTLFLLPLNGDSIGRYVPDGKAAVWRTRDAGRSWQALRHGLPQENVYFGVLRQAMAGDVLDPVGVYFGTSSGELYASADEGETWRCVARHLPTITSIETLVLES
jgi:photosystem II stability/assembly factor-like uncharacterized protein